MEALLTRYYFINSTLVPAVQSQFLKFGEMMEEKRLSSAHTTSMRWVYQYGPELNERIRTHLKATNDSWRVDETYIEIKEEKMYLYRTITVDGDKAYLPLLRYRN